MKRENGICKNCGVENNKHHPACPNSKYSLPEVEDVQKISTENLKALGSGETRYAYNAPDASLLESFDNPFTQDGVVGTIHIEAPEFTSLCPITGQPDFATIIIDYLPNKLCIESKSLKLYLGSFRNHGSFHEFCINQITKDLIKILDPIHISIEGRFSPRGGIPFWPLTTYYKDPALL